MPEDLAELAEKTEELEEIERQLATFVDTIPALAWMANGDGWIYWYNQRWYEYTGTTAEQMRGWGWQSVHDPARLPEVMERWTESIRTGGRFEMVFPLRGSDGVYRSFITRIVPVKDASGKIVRWFGSNVEVDELQRTRDELEASEAQFRQIAEGLPQLVWVTRPDGYHEWYNRRWYEYTGTTFEQCVGAGWNGFFHPDDQERACERWQHSLATGEPYTVEYRCRRYDGEYLWFLGSALPLRNSDGEIVRWFGTCTDIDRQKQAEQKSEVAQERIRVALKNVPLILYTIDRDLRYTWMHRAHAKYNLAEIIGTSDAEIDPSGGLAPLIEFKRRVIESGVADRCELRLMIKGVAEVYDITAEPILDANGAVMGATVAALNITERATVEQELREKSELIDLAQTAVHAGYWSYFPATGECFLSPGEQLLFGLASARPKVEEVLQRIHPEDREGVANSLRDGMDSGSYFAEFRVETQPDAYRWLAGQGSVLTRTSGERYMVGINIDVSERKQVEQALMQSEKLAAVGRLASSIAHEINNPLESVTNLLYLARTNQNLDEIHDYLDVAEREVQRVSVIANQTLRFHKQSTKPTRLNSQSLLADALAIYQGRLVNSAIRVSMRRRAAESITCFEGEIRQVLANLIGNAVDAMGANGGRLLLRSRDATHWPTDRKGLVITVADTGSGIPPEVREKIFDAFFTTKGEGGTGLGLWVSNEIVARHKGSFRLRSRRSAGSSGTVFTLFLPFDAATR